MSNPTNYNLEVDWLAKPLESKFYVLNPLSSSEMKLKNAVTLSKYTYQNKNYAPGHFDPITLLKADQEARPYEVGESLPEYQDPDIPVDTAFVRQADIVPVTKDIILDVHESPTLKGHYTFN